MSQLGGQALLIGLAVLWGLPQAAMASAWTQPKGQGQVIMKLEAIKADQAFDQDGTVFDLLGGRRDGVANVLVEYGLTDRLTLQAKGEWQSGRDGSQSYEGRGPIEVGARWRLYQDDHNIFSVYGGYSQAGETRNAGYAERGQGERDVELRLSAGRGGEDMFGEIEVARRWRDGLPNETRLDLSVGRHLSPRWMLMGQMFIGRSDGSDQGYRAQWVVSEISTVRRMGQWSGQLGWRSTLGGTSTPDSRGPVLAIWRRF